MIQSSASRFRYERPSSNLPAGKMACRCPPKLGDVKRTGIQPWPEAILGKRPRRTIAERTANPPRGAECSGCQNIRPPGRKRPGAESTSHALRTAAVERPDRGFFEASVAGRFTGRRRGGGENQQHTRSLHFEQPVNIKATSRYRLSQEARTATRSTVLADALPAAQRNYRRSASVRETPPRHRPNLQPWPPSPSAAPMGRDSM
jgi:hypothetical protein